MKTEFENKVFLFDMQESHICWKELEPRLEERICKCDSEIGIYHNSDEQKEDMIKQYLLYEFTDRITLLTDNPAFPSLMNYVDQGILTEQELAEALAIQK